MSLSQLVVVVGAHGGSGASTMSLALADAGALSGRRTLLVDMGDPARSGLTGVATFEGGVVRTGGGRRAVQRATRMVDQMVVHLARVGGAGRLSSASDPVCLPRQLPTLDDLLTAVGGTAPAFAQGGATDPELVVVDLGWDAWQALGSVSETAPLVPAGAGQSDREWAALRAWLHEDSPYPAPGAQVVMTAEPTRRGLAGVTALLTVLPKVDVLVTSRTNAPGAPSRGRLPPRRRGSPAAQQDQQGWPDTLISSCSRQTRDLLLASRALPWDRDLNFDGPSSLALPDHVLRAAHQVLDDLFVQPGSPPDPAPDATAPSTAHHHPGEDSA